MTERILVVTPYPPVRDGIGAYAVQQVRALRRAGHHVEVLSPWPSAAHHHLPLRGLRSGRRLGELLARFDRAIVHFHPDVFYTDPSTMISRLITSRALAQAFRGGPPVEIRLHEVDRRWAVPGAAVDAAGATGRVAAALDEASCAATRRVFRAADRVTVHAQEHRSMMVDDFGVAPERVELIDHGQDFTRRVADDRAAARAALGLDPDGHVFCSIGFIQHHKGFDRAVRAFAGLAERGASLHVVGSVRGDQADAVDYQRALEALAARVPGVHLHFGFLSDEQFDRWIVASDTVVLPYRHIWSSSVAERAQLFGRPVIATDVGGLADQLATSERNVVVADDHALVLAMAAAVGGDGPAEPSAWEGPWSFDDAVSRDTVMAEVRRRASALRGTPATAITSSAAGAGAPASSVAPLRRLRPLDTPPATSARPGVSTAKRLLRRAIGWEVDPIRDQVRRLQQAALAAAEADDARLARLEAQVGDGDGDLSDEAGEPRR